MSEEAPRYGVSEPVAPLVRRVLARNPSPFTYTGTGTYIVGEGTVAVIDPGPLDDAHIAALMEAVKGETVSHILITHTHIDHSPAAAPFAEMTGAPRLGFGPHGAGRIFRDFGPEVDVEAGGDRAFVPDRVMVDGDTVSGPGWTLTAVHTPGHTPNHLCFALKEARGLFTGDHVMGWNTTMVSPPDGDMEVYMASLEKVAAREDAVLWPTHGPAIDRQPAKYIRRLLAHRRARETQIGECLADGITRIPDMVLRMYPDLHPGMRPGAARQVFAHLVHMVETGRARVAGDGGLSAGVVFLPPG